MKFILDEARALQDTLVAHRRTLHENPETSLNLPKTTAYVIGKLIEIGYDPKEICQSGVVAIAGGKKQGKTFMLRADMDALPIAEKTDLPFKSQNGNMHACGHDMHTAMLLGAAKLLKEHEDEIDGCVKLMFQPAEETLLGAKSMIEAGVLGNPHVDSAMMLHVFTGLPVPAGLVIVPPAGVASAASDWFIISIQGKGGHGAMPQTTVDPLNILAHIHIALQAVNARELPPAEIAVLTIGEMHGGNAANVIPDTAYMTGTIRTFSNEAREFIKKRLAEISEGVAETYRGTAKVEYSNGCPSLINDKQMVEHIKEVAKAFLPAQQVLDAEAVAGGVLAKMSASEDFAFISECVPSVMVAITAGSTGEAYQYPQHHPKAQFNEDLLYIGAALYASTAMEWLKSNH